jgi:hypothetical protein
MVVMKGRISYYPVLKNSSIFKNPEIAQFKNQSYENQPYTFH